MPSASPSPAWGLGESRICLSKDPRRGPAGCDALVEIRYRSRVSMGSQVEAQCAKVEKRFSIENAFGTNMNTELTKAEMRALQFQGIKLTSTWGPRSLICDSLARCSDLVRDSNIMCPT